MSMLSYEYVLLFVVSTVAAMVVALRFWARKIQKSCFELNDYLVVLALACALVNVISYSGNFYFSASTGSGQ
ncbi:hypothetical protein BDR22DRAFT_891266 [Usnea florida]